MSVRSSSVIDVVDAFRKVRQATSALSVTLSTEDCQAQSMTAASPVKWHLAHTTWFFETFVVLPFDPDYVPYHERYGFLYNSYYNTVGARVARASRGLMTRPSLEEVVGYRSYVEAAVEALLEKLDEDAVVDEVAARTELGVHHEQQHQELILTDVKHLLSCNPLQPAYHRRPVPRASGTRATEMNWKKRSAGIVEIGQDDDGAFALDNESPRHRRFLESFRVGSRLVTCGEYLEFISDGAYDVPQLWLSDGWDRIQAESWRAPLYWEEDDDGWQIFTLDGLVQLDPHEPVCHVSYFEADAFARWAGSRLLREDEWESVSAEREIQGNFMESGELRPICLVNCGESVAPWQLYGDAWEWTQSQYTAYPGYQAPAGAIGEYNGKFMCNQFVLRGGACVTPRSHLRATYRNFFPPETRWQFSGIRLAQDDR